MKPKRVRQPNASNVNNKHSMSGGDKRIRNVRRKLVKNLKIDWKGNFKIIRELKKSSSTRHQKNPNELFKNYKSK